MVDSLDEARRKLDGGYGQVRRHPDKIHKALDRVDAAGPEDDVYELLKDLEEVVKEVRESRPVDQLCRLITRRLP